MSQNQVFAWMVGGIAGAFLLTIVIYRFVRDEHDYWEVAVGTLAAAACLVLLWVWAGIIAGFMAGAR